MLLNLANPGFNLRTWSSTKTANVGQFFDLSPAASESHCVWILKAMVDEVTTKQKQWLEQTLQNSRREGFLAKKGKTTPPYSSFHSSTLAVKHEPRVLLMSHAAPFFCAHQGWTPYNIPLPSSNTSLTHLLPKLGPCHTQPSPTALTDAHSLFLLTLDCWMHFMGTACQLLGKSWHFGPCRCEWSGCSHSELIKYSKLNDKGPGIIKQPLGWYGLNCRTCSYHSDRGNWKAPCFLKCPFAFSSTFNY